MAETVAPATTGARHQPVGTLNVVDPHPLNWLFITWNTMEEPIRVDDVQRADGLMASAGRRGRDGLGHDSSLPGVQATVPQAGAASSSFSPASMNAVSTGF